MKHPLLPNIVRAPRWRRRAEARPEEILEAALAEFVEKGFDGARMEDVAQRAQLSKGALYLYFSGKEALLKALIEAKMGPIAAQVRALAEAGAAQPMAALRTIAQVAAARFADPASTAVPRLVVGLSARFPEITAHYRKQVAERAREAFESLIRAGIAQGVFRPVDPRAAARAFIGPLFFEAAWTHVLGGETGFSSPQEMIEGHLDLLFNGLAAEKPA